MVTPTPRDLSSAAREKPKVSCDFEETVFRTWGGDVFHVTRNATWKISCPCTTGRYLAIVATFEAALEIALLHGRTFHA